MQINTKWHAMESVDGVYYFCICQNFNMYETFRRLAILSYVIYNIAT